MKKKLTSRDKQAIATKKKIYKTGIALFQEHGFDGVNVSQIAKSAGVSVGTFYHYYTSKLDLIMDLYRGADTYFEEEVTASAQKLPFREQIKYFFHEYCAMAERNGIELTRKMYVPDNTLFLSRTQGMHQVLLDLIDAAQSAGRFSAEKTPQAVSDELFLIARGVIFDWALREGAYNLQEKMEAMLDIYLQP